MNFLSQSRFVGVVMAILVLICGFCAPALANPSIAVDLNSGRVLEHEQAFQRWYPASLTKIMTAYVVFKAVKSGQISMDTPVSMSVDGAKEPPSKMYFRPGDRFTMDSALKFLLVKSANDVAVAIAETVAGDVPVFVDVMNATARELGMTSTHFVNPNGLPAEGQYTTARDMAVLAVAVRRNFPEFAHYFSYEGFVSGKIKHANYNLLLGRFEGADGMKTGYICAAGYNQVSTATRNGRTVISVVLGESSMTERAEASAALLTKAFDESGAGDPILSQLQPYGEGRDVVADISGQVCTKEARAKHPDRRDAKGHIIFTSPYLKPMGRDPHLVQAPADLPRVSFDVALSRVPVPQWRPGETLNGQQAPFSASAFVAPSAAAAAEMPLRMSVPIPVPRPET